MKVKIIASKPKEGSAGIKQLIGRTYEAREHNREDGSVAVFEKDFGGLIRLQKGEYLKLSGAGRR